MTTYMFPGQGSQIKGMGSEIFSEFHNVCNEINDLLGYNLEALCLHDSEGLLANTAYTQPALYVVECLTYLQKKASGVDPSCCIGHSVGEYSALFASGFFDFITGLKLVKKRGELMSKVDGGGMLAVINLPADSIVSLLEENNIDSIDVANFNSKNQIVLSGPAEEISRANDILSKDALMCVPLRVSGAFHSRYMMESAREFSGFLQDIEFQHGFIKVISNATVSTYTVDTVKDYLVKQITMPVRWSDTISYLKQLGETDFVEIGPGNILSRLMSQN